MKCPERWGQPTIGTGGSGRLARWSPAGTHARMAVLNCRIDSPSVAQLQSVGAVVSLGPKTRADKSDWV
jgi:hypothetical protein